MISHDRWLISWLLLLYSCVYWPGDRHSIPMRDYEAIRVSLIRPTNQSAIQAISGTIVGPAADGVNSVDATVLLPCLSKWMEAIGGPTTFEDGHIISTFL